MHINPRGRVSDYAAQATLYTGDSPLDPLLAEIGGGSALARLLGVSRASTTGWRQKGGLPPKRARRLNELTGIPLDRIPSLRSRVRVEKILDRPIQAAGGLEAFAKLAGVDLRTVKRWRADGLSEVARKKLTAAGLLTSEEQVQPLKAFEPGENYVEKDCRLCRRQGRRTTFYTCTPKLDWVCHGCRASRDWQDGNDVAFAVANSEGAHI